MIRKFRILINKEKPVEIEFGERLAALIREYDQLGMNLKGRMLTVDVVKDDEVESCYAVTQTTQPIIRF